MYTMGDPAKLVGEEVECHTKIGVYRGMVQYSNGFSIYLKPCKRDDQCIGQTTIFEEDLVRPIVKKKSVAQQVPNHAVVTLVSEKSTTPINSASSATLSNHTSVSTSSKSCLLSAPTNSDSCQTVLNDPDQAAFDDFDKFVKQDYYESKDSADQPLPEKITFPQIDFDEDSTDQEIYKMSESVALWSHPVPIVINVKTRPQLDESIDFLESKTLIAINMFGKVMNRYVNPEYVVIAAFPNEYGNETCHIYIYKYNLHTMGKLKPILLSKSSMKLVPRVDYISDVMFNRIYTDDMWDVIEHKIIDLVRLSYEIRLVDYFYKASDISVATKIPQPMLVDYGELVSTYIHPPDVTHFPVLLNSSLRDHEYRLLGLEALTIAGYNFLARTVVSQFILFFKFRSLRDERISIFTQRGIEYLYLKTDDALRKVLAKRNFPSTDVAYEPRAILEYTKEITKTPLWQTAPLVIKKVQTTNDLEESVRVLLHQKTIAISILGPSSFTRFTKLPALTLALAYLEPTENDQICHVYLYKCRPEFLEQLEPIIMSVTSHKIVPFVDYISDILFGILYPGRIWNATLHNIVDLLRLDTEIREIIQLRESSSKEKVLGRTLETLIHEYLHIKCDPEYFPFAKKKNIHESYLISLTLQTAAMKNYISKKVQSLFYLHHKMLIARDAALNETIKAGIHRVALEKSARRVKEKPLAKVHVQEAICDSISAEERLERRLRSIKEFGMGLYVK